MWIDMNETSLTILIFGCLISGMLGSILRHRKNRPAVKGNNEIQAGNRLKEESLTAGPGSRLSAVVGLSFLSLVAIGFGLMFGFIVGVFSNVLYFVFVFPFLIGIVNGNLIADLVQKAKIRKPSQMVMVSVLSAAAIYGMLHYGRYAGFVVGASLEISSDLSAALEVENLSVAKLFLDYALGEETGHSGFVGYMLYKANQGVTIGRLARSSSVNMGPVLTWLYWLLEFGIIFGVTMQMGKPKMGAPFCESCGNWHGGEKHLGGTAMANESVLMELIRQKDFAGLRTLMEPNAELPSLEVYFQGCSTCGKSPSHVVVRRVSQNAKGKLQFNDALQTFLQPTESTLLLRQLATSGD